MRAIWIGNGNYFEATIATIDMDAHTFYVDWLDGDQRFRDVPFLEAQDESGKNCAGFSCTLGQTVFAIWSGDGNYYEATVTAIDIEPRMITLDWADGDTSHREVPFSEAKSMEGIKCAGLAHNAQTRSFIAHGASFNHYFYCIARTKFSTTMLNQSCTDEQALSTPTWTHFSTTTILPDSPPQV